MAGDIEAPHIEAARKNVATKIKLRNAARRLFLDDKGELKEDAKTFLRDLAIYCRASGSILVVSAATNQTDVPASFQAEGRRETFMRVMSMLRKSDDDLLSYAQLEDLKNDN